MSDGAKPPSSDRSGPPAEPPVRPRLPLAGMAVGAAIVVVCVVALVVGQSRPGPTGDAAGEAASPPAAERRAEAPPASRERQTAMRLLAGWRNEAADPFAEGDGIDRRFEPVLRPPPPYDAVDSTLIDTLELRIRLAHARAVPRDEVCRDTTGRRYACGLEARATLQNHLVGKTLVCRRLFLGDPERTGMADVRCAVDGEDLALRQIRAGWATPSEIAEPDHLAAFEEARNARRGVWAGPWQIPARDPTETDARAIGFGTLRIGDPLGSRDQRPPD